MIKVLFPEMQLPAGAAGGARHAPRDYLANPKAIAAQTYCAPACRLRFHESTAWQELASFFSVQHTIAPQAFHEPAEREWIAFPWALVPLAEAGSCAVWIEEPQRRVRHVRLYTSAEAAQAANTRMLDILEARLAIPA